MPILNGTHYSSAELLDIQGEFPGAFEAMKSRGITYNSSAPLPSHGFQIRNGRLHLQWLENQRGRLSFRPLLRNIGEHRGLFRNVEFVCPLSLELVVVACLSDDLNFVNAYLSGGDLHQYTADRLGLSRDEGKVFNFLGVVGRSTGGRTIARDWLEVSEARDRIIEQARREGVVRTFFLRKAMFRRDFSQDSFDTKVWNHYTMGTAADLMKIGLVLAHRENIPVCGVHMDEFIVEEGYGEAMKTLLGRLPIRFLHTRGAPLGDIPSPPPPKVPLSALARICGDNVV